MGIKQTECGHQNYLNMPPLAKEKENGVQDCKVDATKYAHDFMKTRQSTQEAVLVAAIADSVVTPGSSGGGGGLSTAMLVAIIAGSVVVVVVIVVAVVMLGRSKRGSAQETMN